MKDTTRIVTDDLSTIYVTTFANGEFIITYVEADDRKSSVVTLTKRDMAVLVDAIRKHQREDK